VSLVLRSVLCSRAICSCDVPARIGQWTGEDIEPGADDPQVPSRAGQAVFRAYRRGPDAVVLYLACFHDVDSADRVHAPEVSYPAQGWTIRESGVVQKNLGGSPIMISRMVVERPRQMEVVYNWWITGAGSSPAIA